MSDSAISKGDDGTWVFRCPYPTGCGNPDDDNQPFTSTGWADKAHAQERGRQHIGEHAGEGHMEDLNVFRERRGLVPKQPPAFDDALKTLEV